MRRLLARLLQPLEAAVVLAFYWLFGRLRPSTSSAVGGWLMRRIGPMIRAHRVARRNLERAFPERPAAEIDRLLAGMWDNLGRNVGEFPHLRRLLDDPEAVEVGGLDVIEKLHGAGGQVIFVGAHLANWEIVPVVALRQPDRRSVVSMR